MARLLFVMVTGPNVTFQTLGNVVLDLSTVTTSIALTIDHRVRHNNINTYTTTLNTFQTVVRNVVHLPCWYDTAPRHVNMCIVYRVEKS